MAEDIDKKKPKATLIKHRRTDGPVPPAVEKKVDKKKVVVVKKKVVVKKPPKAVSPAPPSTAAPETDVPPLDTPAEAAAEAAPDTPAEAATEAAVDTSAEAVTEAAPDTTLGTTAETTVDTAVDTTARTSAPPNVPEESPIPREAKPRTREASSDQTDSPADKKPEKKPETAAKPKAAQRPSAGGRGKNANTPDAHSVPTQRISSGKDTLASPPKRGGRPGGVQILETRRTGGRAGVVAGRRVDGKFTRGPGGRGGSGGPGGPRRPGPRSEGFRPGQGPRTGPSNRFGPPRPGAGGPRGAGGRPGGAAGARPLGGRPGGFGGPSAPPPPASRGKKFYKAKKTYEKHKEEQEKLYQYSRKKEVIQTNPVPKEIDIMEVITVSELARKMNLKASDLISKLMAMGMMVTINQQIDAETASILADDYGCKVKIVSLYDETIIESDEDEEANIAHRPPIVTVMGHVDHGKTKLLDAIRDSDAAADEYGGITQHIGAYMVHTGKGNITFLDTPGHSAFTMMRARGAQVTDLVVLVVAANDGVMPQTVEAIEHAKAAGSPIIVAINKMDLAEANPDRVKQQLSEHELMPEGWGGSTQFVELSALKGEGVSDLLDTLILESEMLELKADWETRAEGKVIESKVDQGRGIVSTVLVQRGRLKVGDAFVAGIFHGKVRAMFDDKGHAVKEATPSMPVEILGFSGVPDAGDPFQVTQSERDARQYGTKRQELKKVETARNVKKITLESIDDLIRDGDVQELRVIIKGDVHGSVEALQSALEQLSTKEIRLVCIRAAAGAIIEDDVNLAAASEAVIIGFHVRPTSKAQVIAEREKVEIRKYNVIYDAVEDVKSAMEGMLSPDFEETAVGQVEVRETFQVPKIGTIAGCMVTSGYITRKSQVHLLRDDVIIHSGSLASLKRFKDDAKEVKEGYECGVGLENYTDIQVGDVFEVFEMKEIAKKLVSGTPDE